MKEAPHLQPVIHYTDIPDVSAHTHIKGSAYIHTIGSSQVLQRSCTAAKFSFKEGELHCGFLPGREEWKCLWGNPHAQMEFLQQTCSVECE